MGAHLLYEDFFRFLDKLSAAGADPWEVYQEVYLGPNGPALESWWEQCIGRPQQVWAERVRSIRPSDYGLLREIAREGDLAQMARETMAGCQALLPLEPEPEVYFLVGFFSPDAFAFQVAGKWAIGVGMERLGGLQRVPILLAHEYAHCYRRSLQSPTRLGERLVDEGFAVALAARAFPEARREEHLLMTPGQVAALREYEPRLWEAVEPFLEARDEKVAARVLYGRAERGRWPSRAGVYLGWRVVEEFLAQQDSGFDAPAERVLAEGRKGRR